MFGGWGAGGLVGSSGGMWDDAYDEEDRADQRRPLGAADALRCGLFLGPILILLGVILFVSAAMDPQNRHFRAFEASVDAWTGSGLEAFTQALPQGASTGAVPVLLHLTAPGTGDLLTIPLLASTALPPLTYNASRRERDSKTSTYQALSFVGTAYGAYTTAWPSTSSAYASVNATGGLLSAPVTLVSCSDTVGLQEGIDCSSDSPPAPAPGEATDQNDLLMSLERRRALLEGSAETGGWENGAAGAMLREGGGDSGRTGKGEAAAQAGWGGPAPRRHALQLMQSFAQASATPPVSDAGAVLASDDGAGIGGGAASRDSSAQDGTRDSTALGGGGVTGAWASGVGDGEVEKPRATTCHGCERSDSLRLCRHLKAAARGAYSLTGVRPPSSLSAAPRRRRYYRTVTLPSALTLVLTPPGPTTPGGSLSLFACAQEHATISQSVTIPVWDSDGSQTPPAWCSAWSGIFSAASIAAVNLTVTLRGAGDPYLVAGEGTGRVGHPRTNYPHTAQRDVLGGVWRVPC